jgi:cytochrome c oxidase subunit IV
MLRAHVTGNKLVLSWLGLLALTFISFGASRLGLGDAELGIALGISVVKTLVVLFVFMHLIEQRFANRLVVIVTFLFIVLLVTLTAADPLTRKTFAPRPDPAARPYE